MKIKNNVEGILNYLVSVAIVLVFSLYLSGRIGWFFLAAFIVAPLASVLLTVLAAKKISVSGTADVNMLCKGDSAEITLSVYNDFFIPVSRVCIDMYDSAGAVCRDKQFTFSIMQKSSESTAVQYTAKICGPYSVGVKSAFVADFFGIVRIPISVSDALSFSLAVIPDIKEVPYTDENLRNAALMSQMSDDSEDTAEGSAFSFGGFPGYGSRDYIPGDPLKRVNWKQSVRRNRLYVRTDEEISSSSITIVLDSCFFTEKAGKAVFLKQDSFFGVDDSGVFFTAAEKCIEYSLGLARSFLPENYTVNYICRSRSGWQIFVVNDENEITQIRTELASFSFSQNEETERFPADEILSLKGSVVVFCTPYNDETLKTVLSAYSSDEGRESLKIIVSAVAADGDNI